MFETDSIYYNFIHTLYEELSSLFATAVTTNASIEPYKTYVHLVERLKQSPCKGVFEDEAKQKQILPLLHCLGTNLLIKDEEYYSANPNEAQMFGNSGYFSYMSTIVALVAIFSQHHFDVDEVLADKISRKQFRDLNQFGLAVDTCRYYKKNIPCKCLKDIYKRLKAQPKMGECISCHKKSERSKLFLCGRCKFNHYCSVECQAADYPDHKQHCGITM